ncbi:beta-N-acetylglucosaminidase domain-containing protein [Micromonospora sp. DR5-3]|uniref:beta-N-acetylglucosaminidase domain-containing protein n=1 Tax=unclassified Micromonospora TaxID=2617518 RepID=UPI0011D4B85F|nr:MULTISPECIES: beta-N-acetylglucosaminidase domain-containing protein [unclassified Micromonospora]MCW3814350.1 beta-N-acetylglucosaminidase domain-containing protein [Micromonospora sp. DR5-3]TYC22455.1 beta-N-acetylhexosaminidase [Micromonospora sp. MP36]
MIGESRTNGRPREPSHVVRGRRHMPSTRTRVSGRHALGARVGARPGRTPTRLGALFVAVATALPISLVTQGPAAAAAISVPPIWPTPQSVQDKKDLIPVTPNVALVAGAKTDPSAVVVVNQVLTRAGVKKVTTVSDTDPVPDAGLTIYVGGRSENSASDEALHEIGIATGANGLPREGYVLGIGKGGDGKARVVLDGVDATGTFYAAQTLRQLLVSHPGRDVFPAVAIRDWPAMPLRGVIEGFYGQPWSQQDRLSQLEFYGRTKQNIYVYSPKDDPYLRDQWRQAYPPDKLAPIQELVATAASNHVEFTYALSPGLSVCYSSDGDERALVDKFQSLWDIGVRSFAIPLDDISYTKWNCPEDAAKFGTGGGAAGAAQAFLLNRVQRDFIATHPGAERLQTVPTEYYDVSDSPYKTAIRTKLDPAVIVEWTGVGVVAPVITTAQAKNAREVFDHDILVWDNYPVNDYVTNRLLLGPYVGREPGIERSLVGVTANPMIQAEASKIAEFTSGAFFWNPGAYDPAAAWTAALQDLGGTAWPALKIFAENNYSSNIDPAESPRLKPLIDAFWSAYERGGGLEAAAAIADYFDQMAGTPATLRSELHNPAFLDEVKPWLDKLGLYGQAGQHAVRMLLAQRAGDGNTAWTQRQAFDAARAQADAISQSVAPGVMPSFLERAASASDRWLGATGGRAKGTTSMGQWQANSPANMVDGDLTTFYWSDRAANPGAYVGVDLGSVQEISKIDLYMSKPTSPTDYIRQGVLELSADGSTWTAVGTYKDQPEIHATVPRGAKARYARIRATAAQDTWVVVREFQVTVVGGTELTATGTPPPAAGSSLARAVDGDVSTAYVADRAPQAGESLQVAVSPARPIDQVVVLQSGAPSAAAVQVRSVDGNWTTIGDLSGGYTQLDAADVKADAIRLTWKDGAPAPQINELIPWFGDTPIADLAVDPVNVDAEAGGQPATATLRLASTRAEDVAGTLTVTTPAGLTAQPASQETTVIRGQDTGVPLTVSVSAGTPTGSYDLPVVYTPVSGEPVTAMLTVHVYPKTSNTNLALATNGGTATASSTEEGLARFTPDHGIDGDGATRWSSNHTDNEWLRVELAQPQRIGKVVLRWEAAYGKAYRIETSSDGVTWTTAAAATAGDGGVDTLRFDGPSVKFVRMQGVLRGTGYGYSLYEMEVYPVAP